MMLVVNRKHLLTLLLCLVLTLSIVSCGDEEEPTPTPAPPTTAPTVAPTATSAPPTDTPAPTNTPETAAASAAQPESPLSQESPLPTPAAGAQQPESPLAVAAPAVECIASADSASGNGQIEVISDPAVIDSLLSTLKAPEPTKDNGAVSALLYSYSEERVIPGTLFYLTKGLEDGDTVNPPAVFLGPKDDKGDVLGYTDSCGQLFLDNVPPGKYYLAIWTVYDWLLAFDQQEDEMPLMIEVKAGDQLNLGRLEANWP